MGGYEEINRHVILAMKNKGKMDTEYVLPNHTQRAVYLQILHVQTQGVGTLIYICVVTFCYKGAGESC